MNFIKKTIRMILNKRKPKKRKTKRNIKGGKCIGRKK